MTCRHAEDLLFRERDQALTPGEAAALAGHLAGCASCRQLQIHLAQAAEAWRQNTADVPVPDANVAWTHLRQQLNRGAAAHEDRGRRSRPRTAWWTWASIPAAAALVVLLWTRQAPTPEARLAQEAQTPAAEFVETGDNQATPVVYVDAESGWLIVWASAPTDPARG